MAKQENEKARLLRRLIELYPEGQERRAQVVGVHQGTMSRWEGGLDSPDGPKIPPTGLEKIRIAVAIGEGERPDYVRGMRAALQGIEEAVDKLWATLPNDAREDRKDAKRGRAAIRRVPPDPKTGTSNGDDG